VFRLAREKLLELPVIVVERYEGEMHGVSRFSEPRAEFAEARDFFLTRCAPRRPQVEPRPPASSWNGRGGALGACGGRTRWPLVGEIATWLRQLPFAKLARLSDRVSNGARRRCGRWCGCARRRSAGLDDLAPRGRDERRALALVVVAREHEA